MARNIEGHFLAIDRGKIDIGDNSHFPVEDWLDNVATVRPDYRAAAAQNESLLVSF